MVCLWREGGGGGVCLWRGSDGGGEGVVMVCVYGESLMVVERMCVCGKVLMVVVCVCGEGLVFVAVCVCGGVSVVWISASPYSAFVILVQPCAVQTLLVWAGWH